MFTELIDVLRCPNRHEESWLVATSTLSEARHIVTGTLGCPVCRATFEIIDGDVCFVDGRATAPVSPPFDTDTAFRIAAQLHLVEAPQPILLVGDWSRAVAPLRQIVPTVMVFVGDACTPIARDERVSALRLPETGIPLATGALRGIALDAEHCNASYLSESARVLRARGRLLMPASVQPDAALWRILARDAEVVVAERLAVASAPVTLRRAPATPLFES